MLVRVLTAMRTANGVYLLGFNSAVRNVGDGPLIIAGSRPGTACAASGCRRGQATRGTRAGAAYAGETDGRG